MMHARMMHARMMHARMMHPHLTSHTAPTPVGGGCPYYTDWVETGEQDLEGMEEGDVEEGVDRGSNVPSAQMTAEYEAAEAEYAAMEQTMDDAVMASQHGTDLMDSEAGPDPSDGAGGEGGGAEGAGGGDVEAAEVDEPRRATRPSTRASGTAGETGASIPPSPDQSSSHFATPIPLCIRYICTYT